MSTKRDNWAFYSDEPNEGGRAANNQNRDGNDNYERTQRQGSAPLYSASFDGSGQVRKKRPRVGDYSADRSFGGRDQRTPYGDSGRYSGRSNDAYEGRSRYGANQSGYGGRSQSGGYGSSSDSYHSRQSGPYQGGGRESYGSYGERNSYRDNRDSRDNRDRGGYDSYGQSGGGYGSRYSGGNSPRQSGAYSGGNRESYGSSSGGYGNRQSQGGRSYGDSRSQGGYGGRPQGGQDRFNRPTFRKPMIQKPIRYKEDHLNPSDPIRLNRYLANAGVCSRREADEFIQAGVVKVNGEVVSELGTKITRGDHVMFHDQSVKLEQKVYVLLNKPKNCVTTTDDPQERMTVMNMVKGACRERIFPVGRLDRNTTGVLLLTNDGDLAAKLTHPKFLKKKIYHVWLDKEVSIEDMQKIASGIELEDGEIHADAISYTDEEDQSQVGIEIHSGRNRIVRRIFESLGYRVKRLDRVYFAGLTKKNLSRGRWRYLSEKEVSMLRMGAFE